MTNMKILKEGMKLSISLSLLVRENQRKILKMSKRKSVNLEFYMILTKTIHHTSYVSHKKIQRFVNGLSK